MKHYDKNIVLLKLKAEMKLSMLMCLGYHIGMEPGKWKRREK